MRAGDNLPAGELQLTLSFPNWKEGAVEAATYRLPFVRRNVTPSAEHERAMVLPADHSIFAVSPMGNSFVIGKNNSSETSVYDVQTGSIQPGPRMTDGTEHGSFKFSPDGRTLAFGELRWDRKTRDLDGALVLWNMSSNKQIARLILDPPQRPTPLEFSADGRTLVTEDDRRTGNGPDIHELVFWDLVKRRADRRPLKTYANFAASPQNRLIARATNHYAAGTETTKIALLDWATGKEVGELPVEQGIVYCFMFSPDGKLLFGWSRDRAIIVWDVASRRVIRRLELEANESINSVAVSPDSNLLAATLSAAGNSGKTPGTIAVWTVDDGKRVTTLHGHAGRVYFVHFLANRKLLTTGFNERMRFWNLERY